MIGQVKDILVNIFSNPFRQTWKMKNKISFKHDDSSNVTKKNKKEINPNR